MEPEKCEAGGVKEDVRREEYLVEALAEAAERSEIQDFVCDKSTQSESDQSIEQETNKSKPDVS